MDEDYKFHEIDQMEITEYLRMKRKRQQKEAKEAEPKKVYIDEIFF